MKQRILAVAILLSIMALMYVITFPGQKEQVPKEYRQFSDTSEAISLSYPSSWGTIQMTEGNSVCPTEDTYRSPETMHIYEKEYSIPQNTLPDTESFARIGIRTARIDEVRGGDCGLDFLRGVYEKKIVPEALSSVQMTTIASKYGDRGIYTRQSSRLNTEYRRQYTFFKDREDGVYAYQAYFSFVPYSGSIEDTEIRNLYNGDIAKYINEGRSSEPIREMLTDFDEMAKSLELQAKY